MNRSENEVMNLATKAARGAGAPPAQAADFGRATVRHLAVGRDAADVEEALAAFPEGAILALPLALARVLETAEDGIAEGHLPFQGSVALIQSYAEALPFAQVSSPGEQGLNVRIETTKPDPLHGATRLDLPNDLVTLMETLAARTYVPESEASRLSGAGAGLTDND